MSLVQSVIFGLHKILRKLCTAPEFRCDCPPIVRCSSQVMSMDQLSGQMSAIIRL